MESLKDKVAIVAGAGQTQGETMGNGRATAICFAREGARVLVVDKQQGSAEETARMIAKEGGEASVLCADVTREEDCRMIAATCLDRFGRIDILHNNVGRSEGDAPAAALSEENWQMLLDINLKGVFLCMKYEIQQMTKQGYGAIVNTSSVGALKPALGFCAYSASKSGMISLTKTAALEYATDGIRVNVILPGPTERTLLMDYLTSSMPDEGGHMLDIIPMKRLATPEDIGEAVAWLCSDEASFITGHAMPVDGGMSST